MIFAYSKKKTNMKNRAKKLLAFAAVLAVAGTSAPAAYAALTATSTLSQTITAGTISTDIRDGSNVVVGSPSFAMNATTISTSQQSATGTFGTASQRISVDNPGGANAGWTLTLCATVPGTGVWTSGGNTYAYNGSVSTGRLTIDPSVGTLTARTGVNTNISKGTSASFTGSAAITLLSAAAGADDIWNGYLTGVALTQDIPASQPAGTYTLSMTQTVAAI